MLVEQAYVDRFVRLLEQQAETRADLADLRKEAKGNGHDPKALLTLAKRQLETEDQRAKRVALDEEIARIEAALGAFAHTPLGRSAVEHAAEAA